MHCFFKSPVLSGLHSESMYAAMYVIAQVQLVHVLYNRDIYIHGNDSAICRMYRTVDQGECFYGGPIFT